MLLYFLALIGLLVTSGLKPTFATPVYQLGLDNVTVANVRAQLISSANASWELGTATQALLELDWPTLAVYQSSAFPPPFALSQSDYRYASDVFNIVDRVAAAKPSNSKPLMPDGAVGDPASLGNAFLIRNWTRTDTSDDTYSFDAGEQLDYLLNHAPRTSNGAISHREDKTQVWSDFMSMAPPFMAYFGATLGGPNGTWLMQQAYTQCKLYRQYLFDPSAGLWRHVTLGGWNDNTHWATGNGWAAGGMLRVLYAIKYSSSASQMASEQEDLTTWVGEIINGTWPHQQANGTLLNAVDANPADTFSDTSGTAFLAAVTFRYAALTGDTTWVAAATKAMNLIVQSIDGHGWLRGNVDPYTFESPLLASGNQPGSPEGQAFVLMMHAAWRDYLAWIVMTILESHQNVYATPPTA